MTNTRLASLRDMEKKAPTIREKVMVTLNKSPYPLSTAEIASKIGKPYGSVQPRLSELQEAGKVEDSTDRGISEYGKQVILWRAVA